jgi:hypothetical protein
MPDMRRIDANEQAEVDCSTGVVAAGTVWATCGPFHSPTGRFRAVVGG